MQPYQETDWPVGPSVKFEHDARLSHWQPEMLSGTNQELLEVMAYGGQNILRAMYKDVSNAGRASLEATEGLDATVWPVHMKVGVAISLRTRTII